MSLERVAVTGGNGRIGEATLREFADHGYETVDPQYGVSRPDAVTLGVVHAFGHGLSGQGVHQGRGHAAVTPAVLRELFAQVDGRRRLLAEGLGVETEGQSDEAVADDVVAAVTGIRDALDLPSRLRDLEGLDRADLPAVAETTAADSLMDATPDGFDLSVGDVERVLEDAW